MLHTSGVQPFEVPTPSSLIFVAGSRTPRLRLPVRPVQPLQLPTQQPRCFRDVQTGGTPRVQALKEGGGRTTPHAHRKNELYI